ncbi:mosc domain-containing protein [Ophiostoma piceae UAMH 11346]|uniref:Mosc domain-containing protein n=1 Tax=Ophiostoma piceae (strain UAMH 11346) TaxID=1262450 RepID=S3D9Q1_OPHP1|nr:mosc domain-containing protein [Ophiostoma piceae UAMH 11346]
MGVSPSPPENPSFGSAPGSRSREHEIGRLPRNSPAASSPPPSMPLDLSAPITSDVILEVRQGKMQALAGLKIQSGIDKKLCAGPVHVDTMGIVGDEHDYTFHGGLDKAVHGYCASHYPAWQTEFPAAADRFRPGGFGENLVFAHFNERNVHIGDVFAVGGSSNTTDGLLLQVSLPRQPCFKLNHRFSLRDFAPNTWKTSRTGWYYRVLRPGPVQAGDEVRLVQRPNPTWPLERVQEYLHRKPSEMDMVAELAAIEEFGDECKNQFRSRLAKHEAQQRKKALKEGGQGEVRWASYRLVEKHQQTPRITSFVFEAAALEEGKDEDADIMPGSHVKLRLGPDASLVRSYSIVTGNRRRFELGVAYDAHASSRGGSRFLHESVNVGTIVQAGSFAEGVPFAPAASHHIFVAGGVGITAFMALLETMTSINYSCALHYAVRSAQEAAYVDTLAKYSPDVVTIYDASKDQRMDIGAIVRSMSWNDHISFCGPARMMSAALVATKAAGVSDTDVHFEAFQANTAGDSFEVLVNSKEHTQTFKVDEEETLLDVLQREFGTDAVASSCEVAAALGV